MKYTSRETFEKDNRFGIGVANTMFEDYFVGRSYINPLVTPGTTPVFVANISFEPSARNNWHKHQASSGGGQILICTAGEGWYQEEGKKAQSLQEGSLVYIGPGIKHWHGAKKDSWFSHISIEVLGENTSTEWLEPVDASSYDGLKDKASKKAYMPLGRQEVFSDKKTFAKANMFGTGMYNFPLKKYFSGKSYLKMLTMPGKVPMFLANVNFEPGCRNNWHIHQARKNGGQLLIVTVGQGWYQEEGKPALELKPGSVVYIPAGVKHWHGAKKDSWFSHIAVEIPGDQAKNEWCEAVTDVAYSAIY